MAADLRAEQYDHHKGAAPLLRPANPLRVGVFMTINLAGFLAVNAFWQYLATGQWLNLSPGALQRGLVNPLGEVFFYPLNLFTHPWMVLVTGLLLGLVVFVPIIVSVLHRVVFAAMLVAMIFLVGQAPLLALSVGLGCALTARSHLRSDAPFLAVLLGILPPGLYLALFAFSGVDAAAVQPLQRIALYAPFVIALVSTILASAAVLALTRLTGYRPGVVWPVMALVLAAPLAVFHWRIGTDELDYSLLADRLAPGDAVFEPVAQSAWRKQNDAEGLNQQGLLNRVRESLEWRKRSIIQRCEQFLARHPRSSRAAAVLWLEAQVSSLQLDAPAFQIGLVKYDASFPLEAPSREVWERLARDYGALPQAALARWRLAELDLRDGLVEHADASLREAAAALRAFLAGRQASAEMARAGAVFSSPESVPSRRYCDDALFQVERLLWLMDRNDVVKDPPAAEALRAYMKLDPRDLNYRQRLVQLVETYTGTRMEDNLRMLLARLAEDPVARAQRLIPLAEDELSDAAVEANYELGLLAMQDPAIQALPKMQAPEAYFKRVLAAQANPWQRAAAGRLALSSAPAARER